MIAKRPDQPAEVCCIGKDPMTAELARKVAKKLKHNGASPYKCQHCGHWHVGSAISRAGYRRNQR